MALSYVGGTSGVGTSNGYTVSLNGTLTGGYNTSPSTGDIVIVCTAFANAGSSAPAVSGNGTGSYTNFQAALHVNDTWDTEFISAYKVQGASVDTTLTITRVTSTAYGGATVVQVWRGQHTSSPINQNAAATSASGVSRGTPPAVTPTVDGSIVIGFGAGTQTTTGTAFTIGAPLSSNQISVKSDGSTSDIGVWIASTTGTNGSATTPATWAGGTTSTSSSWAGKTIVLAPLPSVPSGIKVWDGGSWGYKPVKVWSGSTWVVKPVKVWNGSSWITKG